MKNYLILLLLFTSIDLYGQQISGKIPPMIQAHIYLNKSNAAYNPLKAFEIYKQCAEQGNARAMNCLAILFSEGIGTTTNQQEALKWFEQSAKKGYGEAFYNLGNIYRTGWGVKQDFKRAYQWYEKGVSVKSPSCMYQQGYMLFKGLGIHQNYQQAITLFRKGIKGGSLGSAYMLGLCFRNGYGITQKVDSAHYWLAKSASKGYFFAKEELKVSVPENISDQLMDNTGKSNNNSNKVASFVNKGIYQSFQRVTHTAKKTDITGEYSGFVIRYDFSGQHIIGNSELKLKLEAGGNTITGSWTEMGNPTVNLLAEMTDSGLVFNNSAYQAADHYSVGLPVSYLFRNATLQVIRQKDSVFLAGNLQLWSATRNEPEKPIYISLVKNANVIKTVLSSQETLKTKVPSVSELIVYPNPYKNSLQVRFSLNQQSRIKISIADLMGRVVYVENPRLLISGKYNITIQPNLKPGTYMLTLNSNGQVKSIVIVKQ